VSSSSNSLSPSTAQQLQHPLKRVCTNLAPGLTKFY
jgi:hypothetical protein